MKYSFMYEVTLRGIGNWAPNVSIEIGLTIHNLPNFVPYKQILNQVTLKVVSYHTSMIEFIYFLSSPVTFD